MVLNWIPDIGRQSSWWGGARREATCMTVLNCLKAAVSDGLTPPHWAELLLPSTAALLVCLRGLCTWLGTALASWAKRQLAWCWESQSKPVLPFSPPRQGDLWLFLLTCPLPHLQLLRPFSWRSSLPQLLFCPFQKQCAYKLRAYIVGYMLCLAPAVAAVACDFLWPSSRVWCPPQHC